MNFTSNSTSSIPIVQQSSKGLTISSIQNNLQIGYSTPIVSNSLSGGWIKNVRTRTPLSSQRTVVANENNMKREREEALISSKKMTWGEPTWLFFHTLAEKVNDERFPEIRSGLLNIIQLICYNLPCPDCAIHAKKFLENIRFTSTITSKEELKTLLFDFHNSVNIRKNLPIFTREELDIKYKTAITRNIIYNFIKIFDKKNKIMKLIADDLQRQYITTKIKTWLNENIGYFLN
jgi:hypothetical protein